MLIAPHSYANRMAGARENSQHLNSWLIHLIIVDQSRRHRSFLQRVLVGRWQTSSQRHGTILRFYLSRRTRWYSFSRNATRSRWTLDLRGWLEYVPSGKGHSHLPHVPAFAVICWRLSESQQVGLQATDHQGKLKFAQFMVRICWKSCIQLENHHRIKNIFVQFYQRKFLVTQFCLISIDNNR